ncbi:MAG: flagellar protein FhlB [Alphaproteobacteria bacterium]|nr:flagellar protein FhlB [Alphaproteobacteria bacterium]
MPGSFDEEIGGVTEETAKRSAEEKRLAAVALKKYGVDDAAIPRIVAAGHGKIAEQILKIAFENGVKVREDRDLAEILAAITIDSDIPTEALVAVGEILAYVYKANSIYQSGADTYNNREEGPQATAAPALPPPEEEN